MYYIYIYTHIYIYICKHIYIYIYRAKKSEIEGTGTDARDEHPEPAAFLQPFFSSTSMIFNET